jgi:PTS system mannose-specific IIB component
LRKKLIEQAAPPGVKANVIPVDKMIEVSKDPRFGNTKALLLFENPEDVLRAVEGGVDIQEVNVGSMAHSVGKVVVSKVLSMGTEDVETFENLNLAVSNLMYVKCQMTHETTWTKFYAKQKMN